MEGNRWSRREILGAALLGCITAGGMSVLTSCQKGPESEKQKGTGMTASTGDDPCADVSGLTEKERETRTKYEYVGKSTIEGKLCINCKLFAGPAGAGPCGTCQIVKGPINPDGYCTAWVAKDA